MAWTAAAASSTVIRVVARSLIATVAVGAALLAYTLLRRDIDIHEISRGPMQALHG
jgi:hypothetical protein